MTLDNVIGFPNRQNSVEDRWYRTEQPSPPDNLYEPVTPTREEAKAIYGGPIRARVHRISEYLAAVKKC